MKRFSRLGLGALVCAAILAPAQAQQAERRATESPAPIDGLALVQDAGRVILALADENNDGQISQKEAVDAGNLVVGGFFFRADTNGDGVLSQDEIKQARESFLRTKPWLRYAVETARVTKGQESRAGNQQSPMKALAVFLDSNNDKQLQSTEVRQAVQNAVQSAFTMADENHDNQLSPAEVNKALEGTAQTLAQTVFQQADADNNGQISQAEFEKAIDEPARVAFRIMDLNHDGQLSPQEAQTMRQVLMTRIRMFNIPEPSNSPRNMIRSAAGQPPQSTAQPAPANTTSPPR